MSKDNLNLPADLKYSREHLWIKEDGNEVVIGINDYAQDQLGEVLYIELPEVDSSYGKGQEFGTVESVKSVSSLIMPVQGQVTAVNNVLNDSPDLINSDCYGKGWVMRIHADDRQNIINLLSADQYRTYLA